MPTAIARQSRTLSTRFFIFIILPLILKCCCLSFECQLFTCGSWAQEIRRAGCRSAFPVITSLQSRRCVSVKGKPESPFTQRPAVQNMDRCVCPTLCRAGHANARLLFNKRIRTRGAIPLSDDEVPPHRGCTTIHIHTQLIYHMPQNNTRANEQISPPKTKSATLRQAARCFARNVRVFPTCCEIPP